MMAQIPQCVLFLTDLVQALVYGLCQFLSGSQPDLMIVAFPLNLGQGTVHLIS